jgi:hypothetical protein
MGKKKPKHQVEPSSQRTPVAGAKISLKKRPIPTPAADTDASACLVFGLQLLDHEGPYAWSNMSPAHLDRITSSCKNWESMRADEVFAASGNKPVPFEKLCPEAQARLREIDLEEYDGLWELRLTGKGRIWGIRRRHVFYAVWWDPTHAVCPSKMKHT